MRLVNHRFRLLAQDVLNREFNGIEPRLKYLKEILETSIQHSSEDGEQRCFCKMLNVIEMLILHVN